MFKALQHEPEFVKFLDVLKREKVTSYLEIGSKFGGALWRVGSILPKGSRIVAVDLPWGDKSTQPHLEKCVAELKRMGHNVDLHLGDSTSQEILNKVGDEKFDCVFIDANHTLPYVEKDWENYGKLGKIVAFHDIAWKRPPEWRGGYRIDVPQFWKTVKAKHRHEEFKLDPTGQDNGIGVLWR